MNDVVLAIVTLVGIGFFLLAPTAFVVRGLWLSGPIGRLIVLLVMGFLFVTAIGFQWEVAPHSISREKAVGATVGLWTLTVYGGCLA
jgi:hypothetical protein